MKTLVLDLTANGAAQDWAFSGTTAWEACARNSGDSTYISANAVLNTSAFITGSAAPQQFGIVTGITIHYRYRIVGFAAEITWSLAHGGAPFNPTITTNTAAGWTTTSCFLPDDGSGTIRMLAADLVNLQVSANLTAINPPGASIAISELWLSVEYVDVPEYYDPFWDRIPSTVAPASVRWSSSGIGVAAVGVALRTLNLSVAAMAYRRFIRVIPALGPGTYSEICTQAYISSATPYSFSPGCLLHLGDIDDGTRSVCLNVFTTTGTDTYLGLIGQNLDVDDPVAYLAAVPLEFNTGIAQFGHIVRMTIDRTDLPGTNHLVQVFVDNATTPSLSVPYMSFPTTTVTNMAFGIGTSVANMMAIDASFNYFSWKHKNSAGSIFQNWEFLSDTVNSIAPNNNDPFIVKPIQVGGAYGPMEIGQSQRCCELVVTDANKVCEIKQYWQFPDVVTTYDLQLEYRMTVFGAEAELQLIRTSDMLYWDQFTTSWVVAMTSVTIPHSMVRTQSVALASGVTSGTANDSLIVLIRTKLGTPAHSFLLYKVWMH